MVHVATVNWQSVCSERLQSLAGSEWALMEPPRPHFLQATWNLMW